MRSRLVSGLLFCLVAPMAARGQNAAWQALLGADPVFQSALTDLVRSQARAAAAFPSPPATPRPAPLPATIDWEPAASACSAFVNLYRLSGDPQYKNDAKLIADRLLAWNDWLVANQDPALPYVGWGPGTREKEFNCPAVADFRADDLWDTAAALRCLLKYAATEASPQDSVYFQRAKQIIDAWPYVDHDATDPQTPALATDGAYAAAGLRWYRKSNDPCEVRYVKNTNLVMGEQLFRTYLITNDSQYLNAATRALDSQLWDIGTHNNFAYNSYMIYDDVSNPVYASVMVPANEKEVRHSDPGQPDDIITCRDPNTNTSCWNHLGFEGYDLSVIQQLIDGMDGSLFPVASTLSDTTDAISRMMSNYRLSPFGNTAGFDWTWPATGFESGTHITAYNCAQRFSADPSFYSECVTALHNNPKLTGGTILYSLVPDAICTLGGAACQ